MTGGLLDYIFEAAELSRDTGISADEAIKMVYAMHDYRDPPAEPVVVGNVIYVNFKRTGLSDGLA
jgi:hypothetical protein